MAAEGAGRAGGRLRALLRERFSDLGPRIVTAFSFGIVAAACLVAGGVLAAGLVALVAVALAYEWRAMTAHGGGACGWRDAAFVGAPPLAVAVSYFAGADPAFLLLGAGAALGAALDLAAGRREAAAWGAGGAVLIGVATTAFLWLRETDPYGVLASVWIVLVVMATDVGGYFAGRLIGGPKLWPKVSPKKTWSGLGGAVGLAALTGGLFSWATTGTYFDEVCTVSAAAALLAQLGDLGESAVKRRFGVKDSGRLLPGHGGALDRFDGLMAATLVVAAVTLWRGQTVFIWS
ncbi:MAG: phosphatidate cytidylyltransferase [Pseudomonadota bacterium]